MFSWLKRLSIRTQIFLLVLAILFPVAAMLAWFLGAEVRHAREAAQDKVRLLADTSAMRLVLTLGDYREMLRRMAERPGVRALDARDFDPLVGEIVRLHPELNNLGVRDRNARAVYTFLPNPPPAEQMREFPWFREGLRNGAFAAGNAFPGRQSGRWVSVLTYPIRNDAGLLSGLIFTPVDLQRLSERIFQGVPDNAVATVIDREGVTLLRSKAAEQFIGKPSHPQAEKAVEGRSEGYLSLPGVDGVPMLYFFKRLPGVEWRIVAGLPENEIFTDYYATLWRSLAAGLGVLFLAIALAWRIALSILRPMTGLASTAARVAAGDKAARADLSGPKEIAAVARQFNGMLEATEAGERELREGELRTRLLLKASDTGLWEWNFVNDEVYFSAEWKRHLGYADEEIPNRLEEWGSRVHPDDLDRVLKTVTDFREGRRAEYGAEFRLRHRDGSWRWIFAQADFVRNDAGEPVRMLGSHIDITERKAAEAAVKSATQRLEIALESSQISVWEINLVTNELWLDSRWARMLGETPVETCTTFVQLLSRVHPDDRESVSAAAVSAMKDDNSRYTVDLRILAVDGEWKWMQSRGRVVERDASGQPLRMSGTNTDVTAQVHAQSVLRKERERSQTYLDVIETIVVALDATGRIATINRKGCELLGYKEEELLGRQWFETCLPQPEGMQTVYPFFVRLMAGELEGTEYQENPVLTSSGALREVAWHNAIMRDDQGRITGILSAGEDISERKRSDTARQQALNALQKIASRVPGMVYQFRVRPDGSACFPYASEAIGQIYRVAPEDVLEDASPMYAALHPEDRERVRASIDASRQNLTPWQAEYRLRFEDGTESWLNSSAVCEREEDGSVLWHGFTTNISARKEAERERNSLEMQLRESQKMEAVGTLAGGIAHDFNNIIANILGNAELARDDARANPLAMQSLEEILKAGARARDLVKQILSFSRRQATERKPLALAPVVEEAARLLRATLPARLVLHVHCEDGVPPVLADATQIQQVLINLAANAMQATRGAPGAIQIRLDTVVLNATLVRTNPALQALFTRHPGCTVRLSMRDTGTGMDAPTMKRIFEPFFTTKPVDEGTGLGLSVVHGIVQGHEGAIVVESQPGKGATFFVFFPVAAVVTPAFDATPVVAAPVPPPAPVAAASDIRLLYIDDDESLVFLVKRLLERRGYRVSGYSNQGDAMAELRANPAGFDLVLSDYNMPGMSGLDVAREVRGIRADLPVAVASGFIDETLRANAGGAGVRELIFKATSVDEFCEAVQRLASGMGETLPQP